MKRALLCALAALWLFAGAAQAEGVKARSPAKSLEELDKRLADAFANGNPRCQRDYHRRQSSRLH